MKPATVWLDAAALADWLRPLVPTERCAAVIDRILAPEPGATAPDAAWEPPEPLEVLASDAPAVPTGARELDLRWPGDAAPREVADWLLARAPDQAIARPLCALIGRQFRFDAPLAPPRPKGARKGAVSEPPIALAGPPTPQQFLQAALAAHAFVAWRAIERDLAAPMIAVDASRPHHDLLAGWRDLPKNLGRRNERRRHRHLAPVVSEGPERLEILAPNGRAVQLALPMDKSDPKAGLHHAIVEAVRQWQGPEGIRHWAALQRLLSVEGGRSGAVRWTLDAHLDALGYGSEHRRDPAVRRRVAAAVETLTKLELAVYAPDGKLRARAPLVAVTTKYDALQGAEWALEGMELRINEWLYRGVRDPETGELGAYWYPAPATLPQIDHGKHPYAIVLGLLLPMRWRWDLGEREYVALKGSNLLATAGIRYSSHDPKRAWSTLRHNLDELQKRRGLGRYEWEDGEWTLEGVCRLYPPHGARDRIIHGLRPAETPPAPSVLTGAELLAWRKTKGWTQVKAAEALGVSRWSLIRAEGTPAATLTRALREALQSALQPGTEI